MAAPLFEGLVLLAAAKTLATLAHELAHAAAATLLSYKKLQISHKKTKVPNIQNRHKAIVRHAGWLFSTMLLLLAWGQQQQIQKYIQSTPILAALLITTADAITSDLLQLQKGAVDDFLCGNFGLIILDTASRTHVLYFLRKLVQYTMSRGAQSAGIVTYVRNGASTRAIRSRVVNGKRTDLSDLCMSKFISKFVVFRRFSSV